MGLFFAILTTIGSFGGLLFLAVLVGGAIETWIRDKRRQRQQQRRFF